MISFNIMGVAFGFSFSFFALFGVMFCFEENLTVLLPVLCCLIHEAGHILVMIIFKTPPVKIIFYGGGIKLVPNVKLLSVKKDIIVFSAGCIANFLTGLIAYYAGYKTFFAISFALGIFNLLPFRYFDGGQIIKTVLVRSRVSENTVEEIRKILSLFIICLCVLVMMFSGLNLSLCVTIVYIVICEFLC